MLKRLAALISFSFFWAVAAFVLPTVFWVISALLLALAVIHMVRAKELHAPGRFFSGVAIATALLSLLGFLTSGDGEQVGEPTVAAAAEEVVPARERSRAGEAVAVEGNEPSTATAEPTEAVATPAAEVPPVDAEQAVDGALLVAKKRRQCRSTEAIAAAWAPLARVSPESRHYAAAQRAAAALESCRKEAVPRTKRRRLKARKKARVVFAKELKRELAAAGIKATTKARGANKAALAIKWRKATEAAVEELTAGGSTEAGSFLGRLQVVGFAEVQIAGGKVSRKFELQPTTDDEMAAQELLRLGLAAPLSLP